MLALLTDTDDKEEALIGGAGATDLVASDEVDGLRATDQRRSRSDVYDSVNVSCWTSSSSDTWAIGVGDLNAIDEDAE